uniref:Spermatogenesis associated 24 n=1 Tax=Varanus komodoensis TaxID=61221 RepID=A0A8D2JHR0_VARKO
VLLEEHTKTKCNLARTSEQLEFALGEIDILSKQLEREKRAFDKAYASKFVVGVTKKRAGCYLPAINCHWAQWPHIISSIRAGYHSVPVAEQQKQDGAISQLPTFRLFTGTG